MASPCCNVPFWSQLQMCTPAILQDITSSVLKSPRNLRSGMVSEWAMPERDAGVDVRDCGGLDCVSRGEQMGCYLGGFVASNWCNFTRYLAPFLTSYLAPS